MAINTPDSGLPRTGREVTYGGNLPEARLYQQQVDYRPTQISGVEPSSAQSPFAMAMELMGQGSRAFGAYADFKIQQNAAAQHWSNKMTDQQHTAFQQQLVKHKMDVFSSDTGSSEWQAKMSSYDSWLTSNSQSTNPKVRLQALNAGLDNLHYSEQVRRSISAQAKQDMRDAGTLQRQLSKQERQRKAAANTTIAGFTPTIEALFTGDPTKNVNVPPPQIANDMRKGPQWYSQKYVQIANKLAQDSGQTIDWSQPQISMAVHQAALNMWAKQLDNQTNHQAKMFKASVQTANSDYAGNIIHDPTSAIMSHKDLMDNPMVSPETKSKIQKDFATGSIKAVAAAVSNGSLDPSNALQILNTARGSLPKEYGDEFNKGVDSVYGVISGKVKASFYKDVQQYSSKTNANPAMAAYQDGKIDSYLAGQAVNMGFIPTVQNPTNMSQFDLTNASPQMQKLFDQIAGTKATIHKQLNTIDPGFDDKTRNTHGALVNNFTNLSPMPLQASPTQMNQMWQEGSARRQQQSGTFKSDTTAKLAGFVPVQLLNKPPATMEPKQKAALAFGMGTYDGQRTAAQGAIPGTALSDIKQILNSDNPHDLEYAAAFIKANGGTYGSLISRSGLDGKELTIALEAQKYFTPGTNRATTQNLLADFQKRRQQILNAKPLDDEGIRKLFNDRNGTPATKLVAQAFDKDYSTIPPSVMRAMQSYIPNAAKAGVSGDPKALMQRAALQMGRGTGIKIVKGQDHVGSIYDPHDHYSQGFQYRAPRSFKWDLMVPDPTNPYSGLRYTGSQWRYSKDVANIQTTDQGHFLSYLVHTFKDDVLKYNPGLSQYKGYALSVDWQGSASSLEQPPQVDSPSKFERAFMGGGGRIKVTIPNTDLSNPNSISEFYLMGPNNQPLTMSHRRAGRLSFAR